MSKKILVIDDEEMIIKSLTKLLERNNYKVMIVKKGMDALEVVEEETFDLIICDIRMPGINGVETIINIKKTLETKGEKLPSLIFITGYADKDCEEKAKTLNPAAYIYKPF